MKPVGDWGKNVSGRRDSRCRGSDGLGAQYVTHVAGAERAEARSELRTPAFTPCGMGSDERVLNRGSSSLTHKRITVTILRTAAAYHCCYSHRGFPPGSAGKESACNAGDTRRGVPSLGQEDALEKEMATHSSILAWEIP